MPSSRHDVPALQTPGEFGSSRIKIDNLLNPNTDSEPFPRHLSGSWQGTYHHYYHHHHHHHHHPDRYPQTTSSPPPLQLPPFKSIPYPKSNLSPIDTRPDRSVQRSGSASSSPSPYRRDRFPSVSSGSSTIVERRRPPRPKYEEEEMYFIWYHRVDLNQEWKQVRESFNAQFPNRQRNGFQGIQCKYYRFIKEKKCPTLREQRRIRNGDGGGIKHGPNDDSPAYGVIRWCRVWFPWMKEPPPPGHE
ncbi:hypothetical protein CPC735_055240 [Coccidioides posadasii C735 delta SOWgp]|uniref:Uncharacterized protein n=1 Tax=Coccidioides posadasii (strain C735) TaxID=222929 RepID=C5PI01_COCP7|nr:hypothetical protein CPC735_055240 [Coccidioides posadasii C735 delta SOWgp]EER24154.1 hypothetical protein CPC735_055240 [Coccidioides posadasii C735 delta SOWgp]|eukprot:XP_003066299.1 hypothetical protein CPC735_055240 [Coccidioides posadasii C735 delta SOWgp]